MENRYECRTESRRDHGCFAGDWGGVGSGVFGAWVSGCGELAVDSAGRFSRRARCGGRHCGAGGGGASCFGAVEKFGRVDTLVNNARIYIGKRKLVLTRSASTT